jgi:hypothetical protein
MQKTAQAFFQRKDAEERKAKKTGKPVPEKWRGSLDLSSFTPRFLAKAKAYSGKDEAILFLKEIFWFDRHQKTQKKVMDILLRDYGKSPKMEEFALFLGGLYNMIGPEKVEKVMDVLLRKNPHPEVRASVLWSKASVMLGSRPKVSELKKNEAKGLLKKLIQMAPRSKAAQLARDRLFSMENLQVGMPAPDIVGKDLDGKAFRLSDYKGKVILLDFWGDW